MTSSDTRAPLQQRFAPQEQKQFEMERSRPMQYITVTIPNELVTPTMRAIGDFGLLHIVDLTDQQHMSKQQFAYKKRLGDIVDGEKKLTGFAEQMTTRGINPGHIDWDAPLSVHAEAALARHPDIVAGATEFIASVDTTLNSNMAFERTIKTEIARRRELSYVISASGRLLPTASLAASAAQGASGEGIQLDDEEYDEHHARMEDYALNGANPLTAESGGAGAVALRPLAHTSSASAMLSAAAGSEALTSYISGVIPVKNQAVFSRLVNRISRGSNAVVKFEQIEEPIEDPVTGEKVLKSVFCIVTIGRQIYRRIFKLCPLVSATVYQLPPDLSPAVVASETARLASEIREQQQALERTTQSIMRVLSDLAAPQDGGAVAGLGPCLLLMWQQLLIRERAMIDILMKCEFHTALVFLAAWCPVEALDDLTHALHASTENLGGHAALDRNAPPPFGAMPPTYIPVNKFTASFQSIVNTYGMPRYLEFNPGLFTIVTFPFLFGIMFGDIGHGSMLAIAGLAFILFEAPLLKQKKEGRMNEMLDMVFSGRYIIFLMGLFAVYVGVIYNDCMSFPINAQGTNYITNYDDENDVFRVWNGYVQSFGVDSSWYYNKNSLKFFNSLKMKMAVILGVIHMVFGMFLSLKNHLFFRDSLAIVFDFIPRLVFMLCTFGWMVTMIFIKWAIDWRVYWDPLDVPGLVRNPPNLIQTMIDMFLSAGNVPKDEELFSGQANLQVAFVLCALISIPIMLIPKPIIEHFKRQGKLTWFLHSPADDEYQARAHLLHDNEGNHGDEHDDDGDGSLHHLSAARGTPAVVTDPAHSSSLSPVARAASSSHDDEGFGEGAGAAAHGAAAAGAHGDAAHAHSLGDSFIHQAIHTIEFILGAVSNTASYLRLWALSLAHAQLSEVFWEKLMLEYGIENSPILAFVGSYAWMGATLGVIVCMDSLECFLHALRLHWVEFQSKFYYADGYAFQPFEFKPKVE